MKKQLLLACLLLVGCGNELTVYHYNPPIPDNGLFVYGEVIDKDTWEVPFISDSHSIVVHYAFIINEENTENNYFIQVDKATYEITNVGDEIGIIYSGLMVSDLKR